MESEIGKFDFITMHFFLLISAPENLKRTKPKPEL